MRFKLTLEVLPEVYGNVLPISYQYELSHAVKQLITSDETRYTEWLSANGYSLQDSQVYNLYCISNLYVPKIYVQGDRLQINVPRVQVWVSSLPEQGTKEFFETAFLEKQIVIGDQISRIMFRINSVDIVSPVTYNPVMQYQTLSPIVVLGIRPDKSVEYLFPQNRCFALFSVENLIERWEFINKRPYDGDRRFRFQLLRPEKRKAVSVHSGQVNYQKVICYMLKFRLVMDPKLQEIAYVCGFGDYIENGFGYLELIDKSSE